MNTDTLLDHRGHHGCTLVAVYLRERKFARIVGGAYIPHGVCVCVCVNDFATLVQVISKLCVKTKNDVRACINTLQAFNTTFCWLLFSFCTYSRTFAAMHPVSLPAIWPRPSRDRGLSNFCFLQPYTSCRQTTHRACRLRLTAWDPEKRSKSHLRTFLATCLPDCRLQDEKQNLFAAWDAALLPQKNGACGEWRCEHPRVSSRMLSRVNSGGDVWCRWCRSHTGSVELISGFGVSASLAILVLGALTRVCAYRDMETFMDGLRENLTSCIVSDPTLWVFRWSCRCAYRLRFHCLRL